MNRYAVTDAQGVTRTGPPGAWWVRCARADHGDVPVTRARVWNVAALVAAGFALYEAYRFGVLGWFLAGLAAMVTATGVAIMRIQRRIDQPSERPQLDHDTAVARLLLAKYGEARLLALFPAHAALLGVVAPVVLAELLEVAQ